VASKAQIRGPQDVIEAINESGRRAFGSSELVGKPFRALLPEGAAFLRALDRAYTERRTQIVSAVPYRWDRRGGGVQKDGLMTIVAHPIQSAEGGMLGVLVYGIDVTEAERGASSPQD
jgi:PAS domain-containing protein